MIRPWGEGRSSFRHGAHVPAVAPTDDGKKRYVFGDKGHAGLHTRRDEQLKLAPVKRNKKGARCQPLVSVLEYLQMEAVLRPSQSRSWKRAGHNMD